MAAAPLASLVIDTARAAADLLGPRIGRASKERLLVAYLDASRRLIWLEERTEGTPSDTEIRGREMLTTALRLGAGGMILAHNHPSGDPMPSGADIAATRLLAEAAAQVGLTLHDHLIFAGGECRSFRGLGLI